MTTIFRGGGNPTGLINSQAVDGDIFVNTNDFSQRRRAGGAWIFIVPPEPPALRTTTSDTRADVIPWSATNNGQVNDRLAVVEPGGPWELGWRNAAAGVVGPPATTSPTGTEGRHEQTTPAQSWLVDHTLSAQFVNVTVIADDNETILVPRVEYNTPMTCTLHFAE